MTPDADEQQRIHQMVFDELFRRIIRPGLTAFYLAVCERLRQRGAQGAILGCTEICLLIDQQDMPDSPVFDTTALHVAATVEFAQKN